MTTINDSYNTTFTAGTTNATTAAFVGYDPGTFNADYTTYATYSHTSQTDLAASAQDAYRDSIMQELQQRARTSGRIDLVPGQIPIISRYAMNRQFLSAALGEPYTHRTVIDLAEWDNSEPDPAPEESARVGIADWVRQVRAAK